MFVVTLQEKFYENETKITMAKEDLECSFCGRKKPETNLLIAGLDAHICDRCIVQAHGIVVEEAKDEETGELSSELMLRKPMAIKKFLDAYIIGQEFTKKVMSLLSSFSCIFLNSSSSKTQPK